MGGHGPAADTMPHPETPPPREPLPRLGTTGGDVNLSILNPDKPIGEERSLWQRYRVALANGLIMGHGGGAREGLRSFGVYPDQEFSPASGARANIVDITHDEKREEGFFNRLFGFGGSPLPGRVPLPDVYRDSHHGTKTCTELMYPKTRQVPRYKRFNPKIPPPVDGKFNDIYHWYAFKRWYRHEVDILNLHSENLRHEWHRCQYREGTSQAKNCAHLMNKQFALTRQEELTQNFLYMAITGQNVVRETPYPDDFVEQKRKIYDDWLFRTRMKKPGDAF